MGDEVRYIYGLKKSNVANARVCSGKSMAHTTLNFYQDSLKCLCQSAC